MFKWLIDLFKKEDKIEVARVAPVLGVLSLTDEKIREIGENAGKEVTEMKLVTEPKTARQAVKTAPSSNALALDAETLRRRVAQRRAGMEPSRVSSQNTPSRRNDDDDNLLMTAVIASQVYNHSASSSHSYSSHDDGGSYSSGSCDSGGGGSCD